MANNSSSLAYWIDHWGIENGSLYQNVMTGFGGIIYPRAENEPGASITFYDNSTRANLTFDDTGQNLMLALPMFSQLVSKNQTLILIGCTYPLSGQYDHLPRILFYACVIFAVLFRHRHRVAEIALGVVMSYSASACVHLFVLLTYYDFRYPKNNEDIFGDIHKFTAFGDVDFWGIAPVVAISAVMLIPILHWSTSFQRDGSRALLIYWSLLIYVSFGIVVYFAFGWEDWWSVNTIPSIAACSKDCHPLVDHDIPTIDTVEQYLACNCNDFCGTLSPDAPLRQMQGMAPSLLYKLAKKMACKDEDCTESKEASVWLEKVVFYSWAVAMGQGVLALLCANSSTESVRNRIFRVLNAGRADVIKALFAGTRRQNLLQRVGVDRPLNRKHPQRLIRRFFARIIAGMFYAIALLGFVTSPILFILSVVLGELFLGTITTSERSDAVGSWTPWVAAGLVLIGAIISEYHASMIEKIKKLGTHLLYLVQYTAEERKQRQGREPKNIGTNGLMSALINRPIHWAHAFQRSWWHLGIRGKAFWGWIKDPEAMSRKEHDDVGKNVDGTIHTFHGYPVAQYEEPKCSCKWCEETRQTDRQTQDPVQKRASHSEESEEEVELLPLERPHNGYHHIV